MMKRALLLLLAASCLAGCKTMAEQLPDPLPEGWVQCPDERPQICTRIYRPVCAWLPESGTWKSYASDCTACADHKVAGYVPGKCK
mgnify:FL=1|jgi:hypothetical protein